MVKGIFGVHIFLSESLAQLQDDYTITWSLFAAVSFFFGFRERKRDQQEEMRKEGGEWAKQRSWWVFVNLEVQLEYFPLQI